MTRFTLHLTHVELLHLLYLECNLNTAIKITTTLKTYLKYVWKREEHCPLWCRLVQYQQSMSIIHKGFTIVELLLVVVVLGILASIVLVSYGGIQKKALDTSVRSDLDGIAGQLEGYRTQTDYNRQFPHDTPALETIDIKIAKKSYVTSSSPNLIYCVTTSGAEAYQAYALIAQSKSGTIFVMTQDGFTPNSFTAADLGSACTTLGKSLISNGLSAPNTWQNWVHDS